MPLAPNVARAAGLLAGLAAAAVLVVAWQVPPGNGRIGASVRLTAAARGELAVTPTGVLATGETLRAGERGVAGDVEVRNITGLPLAVAVSAVPSAPDLDDKVAVQVHDGEMTLVDERLGAGRVAAPLVLQPGEVRSLQTRAWVPAGTHEYEGRAADVALVFDVEAGG